MNTQNNSLALNAFLDLHAALTLPENPARGQEPDTNRDAVGAHRSPSAAGAAGTESLLAEPDIENLEARSSAEQSPKSPPPSGRADQVLALGPWEGPPESAGDRTSGNESIETHDRSSWTGLFKSLLVAISLPVVWAIHGAAEAGLIGHPGKIRLYLFKRLVQEMWQTALRTSHLGNIFSIKY
jgi:hypothetical protein